MFLKTLEFPEHKVPCNLSHYVAGEIHEPDFPEMNGSGVLGVPLKQAFSEAPTGE